MTSNAPTRACPRCGGTAWWRHDPVRPLRARPIEPGPWRCWACDGPADGIYDPATMGLANVRALPRGSEVG